MRLNKSQLKVLNRHLDELHHQMGVVIRLSMEMGNIIREESQFVIVHDNDDADLVHIDDFGKDNELRTREPMTYAFWKRFMEALESYITPNPSIEKDFGDHRINVTLLSDKVWHVEVEHISGLVEYNHFRSIKDVFYKEARISRHIRELILSIQNGE